MSGDFKIKINDFEGPLDLLLGLIEKRKLHVSQVSLAKVTDDYVSYLKDRTEETMGHLADFVMIASTLMLIKSLSLLPGLQLTEEEKVDAVDLENRLKHLQRIKTLSYNLKEKFGQKIIFGREEKTESVSVFAPAPGITISRLSTIIKTILHSLPVNEKTPQAIIKKVISLEEVIIALTKRVEKAFRLSFSEFIKDKKERLDVVVSFLSMLELVKQGIIEIEQKTHFAEIEMENKNLGVPRY